ncbi:MAG TPA: hypothetical protein VG603_12875 [Chitinophagales bacterium]|nr:hypothetical protein [Chitinophagales bacterium]
MKNQNHFALVIIFTVGMIAACRSSYQPRTVPDTDPPTVTVKFAGGGFGDQYTIHANVLTPSSTNPTIIHALTPGTVYHVSVIATDNIAVANLTVNLNKNYFEISNINASPGTYISGSNSSQTYAQVNLPLRPGTTGTILNFDFKAIAMPHGDPALCWFNVVAMDWGQAGSSNNISQANILLPYQPE